MADFAKQLHEFIELGENIYTVPIFMCESFIASPTPLAMLVFDGSENEPDDEELNQKFSIVKIQAHSDPQELKRLISLKIGNQSILGGYYDNSELIFLISGKEVERHLQEETKECRYEVHIKDLEYHKGVHDKKPVAVVKLP